MSTTGNHYTLGQRLLASREYHKSLEELAKTPANSPEFSKAQKYMQKAAKKICVADFFLRRAIASLGRGEYKRALAQVKRSLKVYPTYKPALMVKRQIEEKLAVTAKRITPPAKKARRSSEKKQMAIATQNGTTNTSQADLTRVKENYEGSKRLYYRGKRAYDRGEIERAKRIWKVALQRYPLPNRFNSLTKKSLTDLLVKEGLEYYGSGRWAKAITSWEEAIKVDPSVSKKVDSYIERARMNMEAIKELEESSTKENSTTTQQSKGGMLQ